MKKIFLSFILSIFFISSITVNAQNFVPRYVNTMIATTTPALQAGSDLNLEIVVEKTNLPEDKTNIEYGVVRRIVQGNVITYEPISVLKTDKSYSSSRTQNIKVKVPNVLKNNEATTYTVYAKITVVDDVDAENFIVSKQYFKIQGDENIPTTKVKYMNFLHSNGERYGLLTGPSIYDLNKTTYKGVASSTSLEIVFNSNVDIVLNPNITFKKLRSDVVVPDFKPESINITKGTSTVVLISLPNFNYEPGVYQGVIDFGHLGMLNVDFQYMINGDIVTFSEPAYSKTKENNQILDFKIYGTPIDVNLDLVLNNISTSTYATSSMVYSTDFVVKDKNNKELYKINQKIDFSTSTYKLEIPSNIKNISKIYIKTTNADGKTLYEGTKDLNIPKDNTLRSILLVILFVLIIVLILIFKHKYVRVILFVIALAVLGFWVNIAKAEFWQLPFSSYITYQWGDADYASKSYWIAENGYFFQFNTNIINERYYTNDDVLITYQAIHEYCVNITENLLVAFSFNQDVANSEYSLYQVTGVTGWMSSNMNYFRYLTANPWYLSYIQKYNMSISDFNQSKAMVIFKNEFKRITGNDFDQIIADNCYDNLCGREELSVDEFSDDYIKQTGPANVITNIEIRDLWNATYPQHFYESGYWDTCSDTENCGYFGAMEYAAGKRRILVTRWITQNLGTPPSTTPTVFIRRVTKKHQTDIRYAIPLLNVVDPNSLVVSVDNITTTSARVNWVYENIKPQTNYQVELSTDDTFSNIIKNKSYSPVTINTFDKYLIKIKNIFNIKTANAATTVDTVRDVTVDGLQQNTKYYVRLRVQNSDGWSNYVTTSFTTAIDTTQNCSCSNRDLVCVQSGVISTTTNASTCNISASCGVSTTTTSTIFTIIPTNLLGNASYVQTSGDITTRVGGVFTAIKTPTIQSIGVTVTDSYDGHTASASCSINNNGIINTPPPGIPVGPIITIPPVPGFPRISITKDPIVSLKSGGKCKISWTLENIPSTVSCVLKSTDGTPNLILTESGSQTFGPLTSNQKYTVTCSGVGLPQTLTASTICRVNGEVREK